MSCSNKTKRSLDQELSLCLLVWHSWKCMPLLKKFLQRRSFMICMERLWGRGFKQAAGDPHIRRLTAFDSNIQHRCNWKMSHFQSSQEAGLANQPDSKCKTCSFSFARCMSLLDTARYSLIREPLSWLGILFFSLKALSFVWVALSWAKDFKILYYAWGSLNPLESKMIRTQLQNILKQCCSHPALIVRRGQGKCQLTGVGFGSAVILWVAGTERTWSQRPVMFDDCCALYSLGGGAWKCHRQVITC